MREQIIEKQRVDYRLEKCREAAVRNLSAEILVFKGNRRTQLPGWLSRKSARILMALFSNTVSEFRSRTYRPVATRCRDCWHAHTEIRMIENQFHVRKRAAHHLSAAISRSIVNNDDLRPHLSCFVTDRLEACLQQFATVPVCDNYMRRPAWRRREGALCSVRN